jgi:hypothetical protein
VPDVEFFFDPVCPWAWITSRWVVEVCEQRHLDVEWRFIALRILNEDKDYEKDFPDGYIAGHGTGLKLLRVAAAVRAEEGPAPIGGLYTQFGNDLHINGRGSEIRADWERGFPDYLRSIGVADRYLPAANDESWDDVLRAETQEALSRVGKDVGTPIITFADAGGSGEGTTQSFFGPVMSRVPRGEDALRLWDAVWTVATFPGMAELKRSLREKPQPAS